MSLPVKILFVTLVSLLIVFGLAVMGLGVRNVRRAVASAKWPKVRGVVLESGTLSSVSRDSRTGVSSTTYKAEIAFGYEVDGRSYTTDTIHFGQTVGSGDSSDAELRHRRYPVGAPVWISYDPANPAVAAVKPGVYADVFWLPGAGLAFVLPGIAALIIVLSRETNMSALGIGLGVFALIFCLAGGAMLYGGLVRLRHAYASRFWPVTDGVIVYQQQDASTTAERREDGTTERSISYGTNLVFQYEVGGTTHFANTRRFGSIAGAGREWADAIARRYPKGARVKVSYCPADPDLAALEPGISPEACWLPGGGLAMLLFGLAALIWGVPALGKGF